MKPRPPYVLAAALAAAAAGAGAAPPDRDLAAHVLNRAAFGPRPGDVERVAQLGPETWIRQQLRPEAIDESGLEARLAELETLSLSAAELREGYSVPPQMRRTIQQRREALGDDASEEELRALRREVRAELSGSMKGSPRQVLVEAQSARVIRAVHAERQLEEVMVEFWLNHFNVFAGKGPLRFAMAAYERETLRPHALGRFEDLLLATAKSPAMLFYLDNWLSVDPEAAARREERRRRFGRRDDDRQRPLRRSGLNENYARELLELHTLGVDGGYTQQDVTELARILTGWTVRGLRGGGEPAFFFDARAHDGGEKRLLGETVRPAGVREGEDALRRLARHPSTARFLSLKLARRFVADEPPPALVERTAAVFERSGGDIRAVLEAILLSPEFLGPDYRGAKVKSPLELVASAVRALDGEVRDARPLVRTLDQMGMPPLMSAPPTGYADSADAWVSTNGTLARLSFAGQLASAGVPGVVLPPGNPAARVRAVMPGDVSETTAAAVRDESDGRPARVAGLLLGSPEFQRR